jgi:hypothetical protein
MTDIAGLPFWQLTFDSDGDLDATSATSVIDEIGQRGVTDLVVFSHGWNNSQATARRLYDAWFTTMAGQLDQARQDPPPVLGLVGVFWPSQRWSDEPIPDFTAAARSGPGGGAAALTEQPTATPGSPVVDEETLTGLKKTFPDGAAALDRIAELLAGEPSAAAAAELKNEMDGFATATAVKDDDDDGDLEPEVAASGTPRMLGDEPDDLFDRYATQLREVGVVDDESGGEAGLGDRFKGIWSGAKEALRQLTYWQMKNRAGVVGRAGLGPFLGRVAASRPELAVHLVGHSFGARLVSYSLAGLPKGKPSPVRSLTLLQGAFSHFAFADSLPFDAKRKGGLAGMLTRVDGPLTVCFSEHDDAVGRFYPLASITARDDSAGAQDRFYRWGGMGHDGAQAVGAKLDSLQDAGPQATYRFADHTVLNVDCSEIVRAGGAPSGAHSDIVHPELTWVVLKAGKIVP